MKPQIFVARHKFISNTLHHMIGSQVCVINYLFSFSYCNCYALTEMLPVGIHAFLYLRLLFCV